MLHCNWCAKDVLDMESVDKELSKPDGSMCDECEDNHADIVNFCDTVLIEEGREPLPEELRNPNREEDL